MLEQEPAISAALIGAATGIASAYITAKLTISAGLRQTARMEATNVAYLTSQVAPGLRSYAESCLAVSFDDGHEEGLPAGPSGYAESTVRAPTFAPTDFAVEWKSLPTALMTEVLTFPEHAHRMTAKLRDDEFDDPPENYAYFLFRQRIYADLGLHALGLAESLYAHAKLAPNQHGQELKERLAQRQHALEIEHSEWQARVAANHERMQEYFAKHPPADAI